MKTYKHLTEFAITDDNMEQALKKAIEKKAHRIEVMEVISNWQTVKEDIKKMFLTGNFPRRVHKAVIKKDGPRQKERIIVLPYFQVDYPEQWIQHIVIRTIKEVIQKGAYFHSYASLPGKGLHDGKKHLEKYIRKHDVRYFFQADIKKFYNSIDTEILKNKFRRIIKDERFMKAIEFCIDNNEYQLPDGTIESGGIPIGAYSSQWFANFFLQDFDHYVKEKLKAPFYIRYMDDMVVLHTNKKDLHKIKDAIIEYIHGLNLELKPNYSIQKFEYKKKNEKASGTFIDFMGFRFYRHKTIIRRSIFYRATRLARRVSKKIKEVGRLLPRNASAVVSYYGWFKCTDTKMAYNKYISPMVSLKACKRLIHWIRTKAWWNHTVRYGGFKELYGKMGIEAYAKIFGKDPRRKPSK